VCVQRDPSFIKFGPPGQGRDLLQLQAKVKTTQTTVTGVEVDWLLSNSKGVLFKGALIPGDLVPNASAKVFQFKDVAARSGQGRRFGIYIAKIKPLRDGSGYTFKMQAIGDFSAADEPNMSFQFYLGEETFFSGVPWMQTGNGWRAPKQH